jgi:flagellar M-ring protein FliF
MRFMDYSMDLGDPIDKSIGDELTENVVSIVRGVLALLVVGLILVFGVRPMLRKFSEGDQLNSYEDPAVTAEKAAEPAALTAEGQRPKLPGTTPAVADIAEDDDPLTATDDDIEAAEVAEYVRKEGIRGNLHKKKIETIQQLADEKPQEVLRVIRSWLPAEAGA